jgi:tetratricopeptide (TPR) repeat protein
MQRPSAIQCHVAAVAIWGCVASPIVAEEAVKASQLLEGLTSVTRRIADDHLKAIVISEMAIAYARGGDFKKAIVLAKTIAPRDYRECTVASIAKAFVDVGRIEEALQLMPSGKKDHVLESVVAAKAHAGHLKEALALLKRVDDRDIQLRLHSLLARLYSRKGRTVDAQKSVRIIEGLVNGAGLSGSGSVSEKLLLQQLAFAYAVIRDTKREGQALTLIGTSALDHIRAATLKRIALLQVRRGDKAESDRTIARIVSGTDDSSIVAEVMLALVRVGDFRKAEQVALAYADNESAMLIISEYSRAGRTRSAQRVVDGLKNAALRARGLATIVVRATPGKGSASKKLMKLMPKAVCLAERALRDTTIAQQAKMRALSWIGRAQLKIGHREAGRLTLIRARDLTESLPSLVNEGEVYGLLEVAVHQLASCERGDARTTLLLADAAAARITVPVFSRAAREEVVRLLLESGSVGDASRVLWREIQDDDTYFISSRLQHLCEQVTLSGNEKAAIQLLRDVESPVVLARGRLGVVSGLLKREAQNRSWSVNGWLCGRRGAGD